VVSQRICSIAFADEIKDLAQMADEFDARIDTVLDDSDFLLELAEAAAAERFGAAEQVAPKVHDTSSQRVLLASGHRTATNDKREQSVGAAVYSSCPEEAFASIVHAVCSVQQPPTRVWRLQFLLEAASMWNPSLASG
jgi:hypothetical protein